MSRRRKRAPGGVGVRKGSRSHRRVEHPAGHSAATSPPEVGHQTSGGAVAPGGEAPPTAIPSERVVDPAKPRPGHAALQGQRRPRLKAHSLIDKVYSWNNLDRAWRRVRRNKGAHGLDRVTIRQFEADWETHLQEIRRKLEQRRYRPQPVRRVYIPKASDPAKRRPLGVPVVSDRIVGQAILQVLDPLFDSEMSDRSFGFRKGRKAHDAIAAVIRDARDGCRTVVDADILSFFDRLDHQVVMSCVRRRIADGRVLDLIEAFLKAGIYEDGSVRVPQEGTPQGGVISPWLANLVLDDLDQALESRGYRHVRYADDFVVLCRDHEEAAHALAYVKEVLAELRLSLNEAKTAITDFSEGFEFLGFRFHGYRLGIRPSTIDRFKNRVRTLTRRQQGRNVEAVIAELNPVVRGWASYLGVGEVTKQFRELDGWIRMRIRSFKAERRCRNDNHRLSNRRLAKWGLLTLQQCRPRQRLSYRAVEYQ